MQKTAACGEATLELLQTFLSDHEPCKDIRFLFAGSSPSVESGRGLILDHLAASDGVVLPKAMKDPLLLSKGARAVQNLWRAGEPRAQ